MKTPIRVAVTGAAGNIGYALLFRIASGDCFGKDQPVILQLLEIPPAMKAVEGVVMELKDAAFPLLHGVEISDDANVAFRGANQVFLVGSRPRGPGMLRSDLVQINGPIFTGQGKAINDNAAADVRVVVVGNPCNTNALIAMNSAPDIPNDRFSAMTRLDQNRAISQLATRAGVTAGAVTNMGIWGNHGPSMYPDFYNASINGQPVTDTIDEKWLKEEFIGTVAKRGKAIIDARGKSSAASAASAAIDHMASWFFGTQEGEFVSMGVCSNGEYGVPAGLIFSFPVTISNGKWSIVEGLDINGFSQERIAATAQELMEERDAVADLLPKKGGSHYRQIDGEKYSASLLNAADDMVAGKGDGRIGVDDAKQLFAMLGSDGKYSDLEKKSLSYIRDNYQFTDAGDQFLRGQIRSWAASRGHKNN